MVGFVYFIRCPSNRLVKIGYSDTRPNRRLRQIQNVSPVPVEPVAFMVGSKSLEAELHGRFLADWSHGEWYRESPGLLDLIERRGTPWPDPGPSAHRMAPGLFSTSRDVVPPEVELPRGIRRAEDWVPGKRRGNVVSSLDELYSWADATRWEIGGVERSVMEWSRLTRIPIDNLRRFEGGILDPDFRTPAAEAMIEACLESVN